MFELRGTSKAFGKTQALQPTDLAIPRGKTTALIGPSGCGKSTILRLMVGLIRPDTGSVLFNGEELTAKNVCDQRHRMGYMIQDGGLFPHLTVNGNVTLLARYLRWDQDRIRDRLQKLTELTHFPIDALERYPSQISGGQRQRVALIRALFLDPDVLLLDEPMGALDPLIRSELQEELRQIFRALNKTVVLVTHDIGEAGHLADLICVLKEGEIIQSGTLEELVRSPKEEFVSRFINAQRSPLESLRGPHQ